MTIPVYHFTSLGHLANIYCDGFIKAHTDRQRPDLFCWFTSSEKGDKHIQHQQFPLARITMKKDFNAVKFNRAEHWEKYQTPQYIAAMDRGIKKFGYVEEDWFVHEGNASVEHIDCVHLKRTRMTPWEKITIQILERRHEPQGTFFSFDGMVFVMMDFGLQGEDSKRQWALCRAWNYRMPEEMIAFPPPELLFKSEAELKQKRALKI